jgi:tetratricopeptide (TPR) repeat protein
VASLSIHRTLRRIPALRGLSSRELEDLQDRMAYRIYPAGQVIWRTRGPLRFSGYLQSGEIELEYRVGGVTVRTMRLRAGDPLPPRTLQVRRLHGTMIATAAKDVRIGILPQVKQAASITPGSEWSLWLWPTLLLLLIVVLARDDLARITSGLFYLASHPAESSAFINPRSMGLLHAAQKVDDGASFAYNEEGYRQFQQGLLSDAESAFVQAVNRDPASAPALNNLGIIYFVQGNSPQASRSLQQSVAQNPDNPITRYNLGIALMQLQEPAAALREFREVSFIDSRDSSAQLQQAYLYMQTGDYAQAEQRAQSALQLNSSLVPAHLLLGISLYNQGRETDALTSFTQALSLQPGNRTATFYQAMILGHLKQYTAALPILQELLVSSTDPAESARIQAEIVALYRFQTDPAASGR